MKDIKSLYLAAKSNGRPSDVAAYTEAVQELLENNPNCYMSNLEYIISSSIGINTWGSFVEKYGLSIACYDDVIDAFESCIEKAESAQQDTSIYEEALKDLEEFREKYSDCFMMYESMIDHVYSNFEYYEEKAISKKNYDPIGKKTKKETKTRLRALKDEEARETFRNMVNMEYADLYYNFTDGVQNRKLLSGMMEEFSELAIPDLLITADEIGESAVCQILEYVMLNEFTDPLFTQCMFEAVSSMSSRYDQSTTIDRFLEYAYDLSYKSVVDNMMKRNLSIIQESALMGTTNDAFTYYTEEEIDALTEYITFKEYQLAGANSDNAVNIFNEICSLYEQLDGIITESGDLVEEDVSDNILPQLPISGNTKGLTEAPWVVNTMNKKTGDVPTYIGRNHDLNYGEDDKPSSDGDDPEDFKRPSVMNDTKDDNNSTNTNEDDGDVEVDEEPTRSEQSPVNNYYYYTYNNSLNKNSHSFNKDSENTTSTDRHDRHDSHDRYDKHDDHSVHNTTRRVVNDSSTKDDHSSHSSVRRTVDDHSTDKRINSNNYTQDDQKTESRMPWELDLIPSNELYTEDVGDADNDKPESDHPIKDTFMDIDRNLTKTQQKAKKKVQEVQNVGRAITKPIKRTNDWITKMVMDWKDKDETRLKEKMADPHARKNLYSAIKKAIAIGAFAKAGLLLNPIFLILGATRAIGKNKREYRIRNEMIGELKAEIEVIKEKIKDADSDPDRERGRKAKYKLMRLQNEIEKKLLRVGGSKGWKKII